MNATATSSPAPLRAGRFRTTLVWTLQVLGAAGFLAAGGLKLAGAPMMVDLFDCIGVGQWFRIVTGLVEVTGGVLLLLPGLAAFGGLLLAITMLCATATHLLVIGRNPAPAFLLFLITAAVSWLRSDQLRDVLAR